MSPFFIHPSKAGTVIDQMDQERNRLRQVLLARREHLPVEERERDSALVTQRLVAHPLYRQHQVFFIYCAYRSEVATSILLNRCLAGGKTVAVPFCQPKQTHMLAISISDPTRDLACGFRNIPEPLPSLVREQTLSPDLIEVAIIPGVVFDRRGHRLGYGGGFYDRFLSRSAPQALRVGLAFSCQVVDQIPVQPHDVPMDLVITEQEVMSWPRLADATHRAL